MAYVQVLGSGKPSASSGQPRVTNILDNMTSSRKLAPLSGSAGKPNKSPLLKPLTPRPKSKVSLSTILLPHKLQQSSKLNIINKILRLFGDNFLLSSPDTVHSSADDRHKGSQ